MTPFDPRQHAPAAERNRQPLLDVLRTVLPSVGTVLEVASGTGQHAVFFADALRHLSWQPSEITPEGRASIVAYAAEARLPNLLIPPLALDATSPEWPPLPMRPTAIVCVNMIHIAPWSACEGLARHAAALLRPGQPLVLYGPFFRDGEEPAPSNAAFDESLRTRDPAWGIRRLELVTATAVAAGFRLGKVVAMPANNLTVTYFRE